MPRSSISVYRLLLKAYPPSFRHRFGEGMETVFERNWLRARAQGPGSMARMWVGELLDLLVSVPREWFDVAAYERGATVGKMLDDVVQDIRYGIRGLLRRPTLTLVLTATLGFGIGGAAAIDSVLQGTLFRGLPYADPEDIRIFSDAGSWSARDLALIEDGGPTLEAVAAYHSVAVVVQEMDGRASAEDALVVSRDFFSVMGRGMQLGGGFEAADHATGAMSPIVIAHSLWVEMGGSPSILGTFVSVDGSDVPIVGVLPPGFYFPEPGTRIYRPMQLAPSSADRFLTLVARVSTSATPVALEAESRRLTEVMGRSNEAGAEPVRLLGLRTAIFGQNRGPMLLTTGALLLVLLMAGINVSTLLMANMQRRLDELSIRIAIGASRRRITLQLMTESALLGVLGACAALLLGVVGFGLLVRSLPITAGDASRLAIDLRFVFVVLGLGLSVGTLAGLGVSIAAPIGASPGRRGLRHGGTPRATLLQNGLVITQIALSVALVGGAGVLIRSVQELSQIETGMSPGQAVVLDVVVGSGDYPAAERAALYRDVLEGIAALPETEAVGLTQKLPLRGPGWTTSVSEPGSAEPATFTPIRFISPGYFEALGVPVVSGRLPTASLDGAGGVPAAWVNRALAERMWPGEDPSGQRRLTAWGADRAVTGVVGNVAEAGLTDSMEPAIYVSIEQIPRFLSFVLVARPRPGVASGYAGRVQGHLRETQPRLAVQATASFDGIEAAAQGDTLVIMRLLVLLGVLALIVGAVGVHGVVSQWVSGRVRGWAVALALGATPREVVGSVVWRSVALTGAGVVVGIVLFAVGGSALDSLVYGVQRLDVRSLLVTSAVMIATGVIGAAAPAVRAGRTDPVSLLKLQ